MSTLSPYFTKNTADLLTLVLVLFTSLAHLFNLSSVLGEVRKTIFIVKSMASILQILKILNFMRGFKKFAWVVAVIQQNTYDMTEVSRRAALFVVTGVNRVCMCSYYLKASGVQASCGRASYT